ncbi:TetR/AcrR family transcriptional regulator [Patulibacter americanus]|uniref:TetR/AcrR family transcriptional regulator n=1 Tax=Patulibacter americanus TaxID=588672 RepID=UPI0003B685DF|nr:TetR/AcrR family transcriptional regulator [Patulibacter americanus]
MPKLVDHEARRRDVAHAVWRVVRREGLDGASVRAVAVEAGLSTGSMRHYFDGQADLQRTAMEELTARVGARLAGLDPSGRPPEVARRIVAELLPLDDERQAEAEAWFAFVARARTDEAFRELANRSYEGLRALVRQIVALAQGVDLEMTPDAEPPEVDEVEVERLFALLDGLVLHAVQRPGLVPAETLLAVVDRHLKGLIDGG